MASTMTCNAFCTILSLGEAIVNGLVLFELALAISTLLEGLNSYLPCFISLVIFSNHSKFIPSSVVFSITLVMLPGLPLIVS